MARPDLIPVGPLRCLAAVVYGNVSGRVPHKEAVRRRRRIVPRLKRAHSAPAWALNGTAPA